MVPSAADSQSVTNSSEIAENKTLEDDKSKAVVVTDSSKMKSKPVESDSESEKEVEEDLDESSNIGDSILQQLPISSTPASVTHTTNSQTKLTAETEQRNSQLFTSKLPAINKATLPPLSLPQGGTNHPITNAIPTDTVSSDTKASAAISITNVTTTSVTTVTTTLTNGTDTATVSDKPVLEAKPLSDKDAKPVDLVIAKNGHDDVEQSDEKESSHDRLVTVTPLSHSISSELSGTLSDDSIAVTPTESIDVSDSGVYICMYIVCMCI